MNAAAEDFNVDIVGYYLLASKIITLPFSVIGNSISTVYKQTAIEEFSATNAQVEAAIAPAKNQMQFRVL